MHTHTRTLDRRHIAPSQSTLCPNHMALHEIWSSAWLNNSSFFTYTFPFFFFPITDSFAFFELGYVSFYFDWRNHTIVTYVMFKINNYGNKLKCEFEWWWHTFTVHRHTSTRKKKKKNDQAKIQVLSHSQRNVSLFVIFNQLKKLSIMH